MAYTLTDAERHIIRIKSGDDCGEPLVDDDTLDAYYDASAGDRALTIVSVLEDRWAAAKAETSVLSELGTRVDTANADIIKQQLDYWRGVAGLPVTPVGGIGVGVMSLGLDYTDDDLALTG